MKLTTMFFRNTANGFLYPNRDLGLITRYHEVTPPTPKLHRFSIDGMDGELDMTEWAGEVKYNPRTVKIGLRDMESSGYSDVVQFVHGRSIRVYISDEPDYYYDGRCTVCDVKPNRGVTDIDLEFACNPFKLARKQTTIEQPVTVSTTITLQAARMTVTPKIVLTRKATLNWRGKSWTKSAGTYTIDEFRVTDKPEPLVVSGSGKITLTWRDGVL